MARAPSTLDGPDPLELTVVLAALVGVDADLADGLLGRVGDLVGATPGIAKRVADVVGAGEAIALQLRKAAGAPGRSDLVGRGALALGRVAENVSRVHKPTSVASVPTRYHARRPAPCLIKKWRQVGLRLRT